jgi:thiamine-monophosphate kinase
VSEQQATDYALSAGDDYELIFTVSEEQRGSLETSLASTNVKATCIGQLTGQPGALSLLKNNEKYTPKTGDGYEHVF